MLSKRLNALLQMIPHGSLLVDIGTDHGYLVTEAIKNKIIYKAIATDVSKNSLQKAVVEIGNHKLEKQIETRLGNGLEVLGEDEVDVVVIAGMGGILISEIIDKSYHKVFKNKHPLLILQPVQLPEKLRQYLYKNNFNILDEDLVEDDGLLYHIIVCQYSAHISSRIIEFPFDELGEINHKKNNSNYIKLLLYKIKTNNEILKKLNENNNSNINKKTKEIIFKIKYLEELVSNVTK